MKDKILSFSQLKSLLFALEHFPEKTPLRWSLIAKYVSESKVEDKTKIRIGGSLKSKSGEEEEFNPTPEECKTVSQWLTKNHPQLLESFDESEPFFKWSEKDAFKPIVLLPSKLKCCGSSITIRNRPSFPVVYTSHGTNVAASFNGNCKTCRKVYYYSYFEDCPVSESDSNKDSKDQRRVYYDFSPDLKYFQVSNKTMFETHLVKDIVYNVEICASSFESRADVYNFIHRELDKEVLRKLENFSRVKGNNEDNVWKLNADRVEECYFLWKTINLFRKNGSLYLLNVKQVDVEGKRRSLEEICLESWKLICKLQNKWIHHRCEVPGCTEGYISVDGLEKVRRPMCAAPKEKLSVNKGEGNFIKCCTNTPTLGGKSQKASKFCWEHLHLQENDREEVDETESREETENRSDEVIGKVVEKEAHIYPISAGYIDQKVVGDIPEHDGLDREQGGCKSKEKVNRYMDRTAGLLTAVRPCGIIVKAQEMYTCESCTQVYAFLLLTFGRTTDDLMRLKFVGYDRACDLHPFLSNLSKKGNVGAKILLDHVKFLVDIFHVMKHKEQCCMPPNNPKCRYHPHLETFKDIRGTNTESAEQSNRFLNRFKHMCKRMAEFKFKAFMWFVIETHNELIEERLKAKGKMK